MAYDLEFEKPLADLEKRIAGMRKKGERLKRDEQEQLQKAEQELARLTKEIYARLTDWQTVQVARHKDRPHAIDLVRLMCDDFFEMHGDRTFGDNPTIMGGPARLGDITVMMLCHEKGRGLKEQRERNAGQPRPEGFRKAQRLMLQAEKFALPVICLIDTPGASISLEDEERGQSAAIATSILQMAQLRVPIISTVIGEGGSGGALALGVADYLFMLEYTYFSVAAPESVASIIWRSTKFAAEAAEGQHISARRLHKLGLVDDLIPEPLGGAHHDHHAMAETLKTTLLSNLEHLRQFSLDELLARRYQKFRSIGVYGYADAPADVPVDAAISAD
ncbi:MAG: acetyl-CoA carboxylase carboxyltransferase subunit alpha [Ktedonobacteraceae bacterium]